MKQPAARTVVRHRYFRAGANLRARVRNALYYVQHRPLGPDEKPDDRVLFAAATDNLSRQQARAMILDHAGHYVAYHRLIISPGRHVEDMQRWTRQVMADLSHHLDQRSHWVAVVHRNTAHHHTHVLLAGTGERARQGRCRGAGQAGT